MKGTVVPLERTHLGRRNRLLGSLPAADLAMLRVHLKEVDLQQGAVLQEQGERIDHVHFPHGGIVSLMVVMGQGEAIETATLGREGAIGLPVGLGQRRSPTRAVVQVAGTSSRIASNHFRRVAADSQAVRDMIARHGEILLIQIQQTAACNALHDVEERLSRWLLQARDRVDDNTIRFTHEFLSQMLGVRRPTVTVVAKMLQEAGLIRYHRGQIEILNRQGLEARACECYGTMRKEIANLQPPGRA
jgi:CRP-like cAMP-binding protein